jgi:hypothetical protein
MLGVMERERRANKRRAAARVRGPSRAAPRRPPPADRAGVIGAAGSRSNPARRARGPAARAVARSGGFAPRPALVAGPGARGAARRGAAPARRRHPRHGLGVEAPALGAAGRGRPQEAASSCGGIYNGQPYARGSAAARAPGGGHTMGSWGRWPRGWPLTGGCRVGVGWGRGHQSISQGPSTRWNGAGSGGGAGRGLGLGRRVPSVGYNQGRPCGVGSVRRALRAMAHARGRDARTRTRVGAAQWRRRRRRASRRLGGLLVALEVKGEGAAAAQVGVAAHAHERVGLGGGERDGAAGRVSDYECAGGSRASSGDGARLWRCATHPSLHRPLRSQPKLGSRPPTSKPHPHNPPPSRRSCP